MPALFHLANEQKSLQVLQASLINNFKKVKELTHFAKGYFDGKKVTILDAQESYRLSSFAKANCLVVLEGGFVCGVWQGNGEGTVAGEPQRGRRGG